MDNVRAEPERNPEEYHQVGDENEKGITRAEQQYTGNQECPQQCPCDYGESEGFPSWMDFANRRFIDEKERQTGSGDAWEPPPSAIR